MDTKAPLRRLPLRLLLCGCPLTATIKTLLIHVALRLSGAVVLGWSSAVVLGWSGAVVLGWSDAVVLR